MGIRGSISTMGLPDVFQWLKLGAKTGVLLVDRQSRSTQVFFQKGAIADLREPDQTQVLLSFLVRGGFPVPETKPGVDISEVLPLIARRMAPNRADGTLPQALLLLEEPIRDFFVNRLLDLFAWEFGEFSFRDNQSSGRLLLTKPVELEPLMLEWADRTLELKPIRAIFPDSPLVSVQAKPGAEGAGSNDTERRVLKACRVSLPLLELYSQTGMTEFESLKLLHRLSLAGLLTVVTGAEAKPPPPPTGASNGTGQKAQHLTLWNQRPSAAGPGGALVEESFRRLRTELAGRSDLTGLGPEAIPRMLLRYDSPELMHLKLSPDEGFLLSRVDGITPLRQIAALSGLSRDATAGLVLSLIVRGVLDAQGAKGIVDARNVDRAESLLQHALSPLSPRGDSSATPAIDIDWRDEAAGTTPAAAAPGPAAAAPLPVAPAPAVPISNSQPPAAPRPVAQAAPVATHAQAAAASAGVWASAGARQALPAAEAAPPSRREPSPLRTASAPEPPFVETQAPPAAQRPAATAHTAHAPGASVSAGTEKATDPRELAALYMKLGMRALKEQQYGRAIDLFSNALTQDESNSAGWAALAQAYLLEGNDLEEAERCCRRALEGNDWNSRLHLLLGYIQRGRDQPDLAAQSFFRALELDHTNPQIHEALRSIHLR
jgi:uncharacterized protein DUF4388/tetratricopeptide repeat protein